MLHSHKIIPYLLLIAFIAMTSPLHGCHPKGKQIKKTLTIQPQPITKTLYFAGTIQPLTQTPVITPIEGVVSEIFFKYGHIVQKDQLLCTIHSSKQTTNYETTVTDYLKTKQKLLTSQRKMKNITDLFNQGLVSKNEYENTKTEYALDSLSFSQIQSKMDTLLKQYQIKNLSELSITNTQAVKKALELGKKSISIQITAPQSGMALFSKESKIQTGTQLDEGEVLLYLGDITGISTEIEVNEMNINQLHEGQEALIVPAITPNLSIKGIIKSINLQATKEDSLPTFSVKIIVPELSPDEQKQIHIGMSAKIAIPLSYPGELSIPLSAVFQENMQSFVHRIDPKTKKITKVKISTGETTENAVIITSGLQAGDQIVLSH